MALLQLDFTKVRGERTDDAISEERISGVRIDGREAARKVDEWVVPERLLENSHATRLQHTIELPSGLRILDHVMQDAEADGQIEEGIGIVELRRVHCGKLRRKSVANGGPVPCHNGRLGEVESPGLCSAKPEIYPNHAEAAPVVEHAFTVNITHAMQHLVLDIAPPVPAAI